MTYLSPTEVRTKVEAKGTRFYGLFFINSAFLFKYAL
jgi:hypothetical protein